MSLDRHYVALIDGVILDTYDSGGFGKCLVKGYWSRAAACTEPVNDNEQATEAQAA